MSGPMFDAGKFIDYVWNLREERDQLHAANQRLDVKCSLLDTARVDAEEKQWAAERENRRLEGEVARLRDALVNIAENSEDQGAIDHARAALSTNGEVTE